MKLDRRKQIIDMIARHRMVKNAELMERFGISIETVRRDLEQLEKQGYLRRVYGGAVINVTLGSEPEYDHRMEMQRTEKDLIGKAAAALVRPKDTIFLGVGTTVQSMVHHLSGAGPFTAFTNALRTAVELSELPDCSVLLPGGNLRKSELTLSGFPAEENMENFNVDIAFIGTGGITENGIMDFHTDEARLHRKMLLNATTSVALADSGKFGVQAMNKVCSLSEIDIIITDEHAQPDFLEMLEKKGVRVIIAGERKES